MLVFLWQLILDFLLLREKKNKNKRPNLPKNLTKPQIGIKHNYLSFKLFSLLVSLQLKRVQGGKTRDTGAAASWYSAPTQIPPCVLDSLTVAPPTRAALPARRRPPGY